jgi:hypothetical protein
MRVHWITASAKEAAALCGVTIGSNGIGKNGMCQWMNNMSPRDLFSSLRQEHLLNGRQVVDGAARVLGREQRVLGRCQEVCDSGARAILEQAEGNLGAHCIRRAQPQRCDLVILHNQCVGVREISFQRKRKQVACKIYMCISPLYMCPPTCAFTA